MPNEKTDNIHFDDTFQDVSDTMSKCHEMIQKITTAQKALKLKDNKKTVGLYLTDEQLDFLQHCVNMELSSAIGYDDEDDDEYEGCTNYDEDNE